MAENGELLRVERLVKYFPVRGGIFSREVAQVKAVDGVDLSIKEGETLGLVGESGCGKSTLGRTILRLLEPTSGEIYFEGQPITRLPHSEMREIRRKMQIIFQDPYSSLNRRMTVGDIVGEAFSIHKIAKGKKRREMVTELLLQVGLREEVLNHYPHEFSGGQRQRIGIARALAVKPKLIVADEPISALDVSIQAQILNLMVELQTKFNLTYLFIAHDLRLVEHISDRIAVMYLGKVVELADSKTLYFAHHHPYAHALLSAVPLPNPKAKLGKERVILEGDVPSPINRPPGCVFRPRCRYATDLCMEEEPMLRQTDPDDPEHLTACHHAEEASKTYETRKIIKSLEIERRTLDQTEN
jgi:oligopeptide/dipeptide ABC transporter ATP-binding protein